MPGAITHFYRCINLAMDSLVWPDPVSFMLMCCSFKVSVCGWREGVREPRAAWGAWEGSGVMSSFWKKEEEEAD